MEGARYLNCCLRTIWKCLPFQFQLFSVLFIYYGVAFFEIWKGKNIPKLRWLRPFALDHWYWLCLWFTDWTAGLFPVIYFGLWGGSLGWWAPSLAWRFFCGSVIFSGLWGRQPTLHHYGADFLVWIRHVFGHFSFPLCLLSVCFSASTLAPKCRRRCQETELEWNPGHSFIHQTCIWTAKLQRSTIHGPHVWRVQTSSGEDTVQLIHVPHHGKPAMVLTAWAWSTAGKATKPWTLGNPLQRVWQKSIWHFKAMFWGVICDFNFFPIFFLIDINSSCFHSHLDFFFLILNHMWENREG